MQSYPYFWSKKKKRGKKIILYPCNHLGNHEAQDTRQSHRHPIQILYPRVARHQTPNFLCHLLLIPPTLHPTSHPPKHTYTKATPVTPPTRKHLLWIKSKSTGKGLEPTNQPQSRVKPIITSSLSRLSYTQTQTQTQTHAHTPHSITYFLQPSFSVQDPTVKTHSSSPRARKGCCFPHHTIIPQPTSHQLHIDYPFSSLLLEKGLGRVAATTT